MQSESSASSEHYSLNADCPFCQRSQISDNILKETPAFRVLADHAPLVSGHILIVPRNHASCYGDVPAALDAELAVLKEEVQRFFGRYYEPAVFWEHGIFRQTVFHAHLHCFPFGETRYNPIENMHELEIYTQDDIRAWHQAHGQYFYLADTNNAFLFAPRSDHYLHVIQDVLWSAVVARNKQTAWLPPRQRQEMGVPLIKELQTKWQSFQEEEQTYINETGI